MISVSSPASPADLDAEVAQWCRTNRADLKRFGGHDHASIEDGVRRERELQKWLWDAGWTRYGWPVEVGGLGGHIGHRAAVYQRLTREGVVIPEPFSLIEVLAPTLIAFAPALAEAEVARYVSGETLWSLGLSEPEAGSDLWNLRTRAEIDGAEVRITGHKTWNGMGQTASHVFLLCRTGSAGSRHRGLTYFLVDLDAPGVTVRPIPAITGRDEFCDIYFDDVRIPLSRRVGEVDGAATVTRYLTWYDRGAFAWVRQCWLRRRLDDLVRDGDLTRVDPVALGELCMDMTALRLRGADTIDRLRRGEDLGSEVSYDKLLLADAEQAIAETALRVLHQPIVAGDDPLGTGWRFEYLYAHAASIYGGSNEIQLNAVAESILGLPR